MYFFLLHTFLKKSKTVDQIQTFVLFVFLHKTLMESGPQRGQNLLGDKPSLCSRASPQQSADEKKPL